MKDTTLSDRALFGSIGWAAETLGMSRDTFFRKRSKLESVGFPKIDPILKSYPKAAVIAWAEKRGACANMGASLQTEEPNYDEI